MALIDQTAISRAAKYRLKKIFTMLKKNPRPTLEMIGVELGISKQRVSQILKKASK